MEYMCFKSKVTDQKRVLVEQKQLSGNPEMKNSVSSDPWKYLDWLSSTQPKNSDLSPGQEDQWEMHAAWPVTGRAASSLPAALIFLSLNTLSNWLGTVHVMKPCSRLLVEDVVEEICAG